MDPRPVSRLLEHDAGERDEVELGEGTGVVLIVLRRSPATKQKSNHIPLAGLGDALPLMAWNAWQAAQPRSDRPPWQA
jgi:hypothetical protein